jgi:glycosyltransferase involved in cell wall biosynthesis
MNGLRINLFTHGDCQDINTWSNLPYYFSNALEAQNVQINRINLIPWEYLRYRLFCRWTSGCEQVYRLLGRKSQQDPFRTKTNYLLTNEKLRAVLSRFHDVDLNLFLTFSFSSYTYAAIPAVHYCDRTYEHFLEDCGRAASRRDRMLIDVERRNLENAELVLTTNQACTDFLNSRYDVKRLVTLKGGMNTDAAEPNVEDLIAQKERSKHLLFIGRGVHSRGVDILIRAFRIFNADHHGQFNLHVVGVSRSELPLDLQTITDNIRFYPYLDRGAPEQRDTYNELIRNARLFVLPMRPGPLPNVLQEVQFYCTPVIISNVTDALDGMTEGYNFVRSLQSEDFAREMTALIADTGKWRESARGAHNSVKKCTWSRTAETFVEIVNASGILNRRAQGIAHNNELPLQSRKSPLSIRPRRTTRS